MPICALYNLIDKYANLTNNYMSTPLTCISIKLLIRASTASHFAVVVFMQFATSFRFDIFCICAQPALKHNYYEYAK